MKKNNSNKTISVINFFSHKMTKKFIANFIVGCLVISSITLPETIINNKRVVAANSSNYTEQTVSKPNNYKVGICFLGFCIKNSPIPGPFKNPLETKINDAIKAQLRSFLSDEIPITGTEHKLYPTSSQLPGSQFAPRTLYLNILNPSQVIPPGDYEIPVHYYCTKVYTLNGAGNRYRLARLNGRLSNVLSTLYQRASLNKVPTQDVQVLSWSIQSGVSYDNLSSSSKGLVNQLIPDYRQELNGSFTDQTIKFWNSLSQLTSLPSLDATLNQLGDMGTFAKSLFRAREEIIRTNFSYRPLANSFVIPQDVNLPGGIETTPWSKINEQVYLRFIAPRGALNDGVAQVRILGIGQNKELDKVNLLTSSAESKSVISSLPSNNNQSASKVTAQALLSNISQSVGIPEQNGQALTATAIPAPEGTVATIPSSQPSSRPCHDPEIINKYDKDDPQYHFYGANGELTNTICSKKIKGCTRERVFEIMISQARFIAPTFDNNPVIHCQQRILVPNSPIKTFINQNDFSIKNYTLRGHIFYPGEVTRKVIDTGTSIAVMTTGEGVGKKKEFNLLVSPSVWDAADARLRVQTMLILDYENNNW